MGGVTGDTAARIVPDIRYDDRPVRIVAANGKNMVETGFRIQHRHGGQLAHGIKLTAELFGQRIALCPVIIGYDNDARSHIRHIARHKTVNDGDRQDAIPAFHRLQSVDVRAHRLAAGGINGDHAAIESGDDRLDLPPKRAQRHFHYMLAALFEIRMWKLQKRRHYIEIFDPKRRQMAVRIEFRRNQHIRSDQCADARQEIPFRIVITLCHHGAVQTEHHRIDRHCGAEFCENRIPQRFIGLALDKTRRFRPTGSSLYHREPFRLAATAQDRHWRRAERRRFGMFPRPGIKSRAKGVHIRRDR